MILYEAGDKGSNDYWLFIKEMKDKDCKDCRFDWCKKEHKRKYKFLHFYSDKGMDIGPSFQCLNSKYSVVYSALDYLAKFKYITKKKSKILSILLAHPKIDTEIYDWMVREFTDTELVFYFAAKCKDEKVRTKLKKILKDRL